ncbi:MAG TPA: NAD-dependent epimerase/dehydratase family protein [Nitrospiria bacterium]|jgi:nucleoside-diphosphate-sugar epimerase
MGSPKTILITGAAGFLGRALCQFFLARGFSVRALVRSPENHPISQPGIQVFKGSLPDEIDPKAFEGTQTVVHCAYTTKLTDRKLAYRVNHVGTMKVYELSKKAGVDQFVFISSTGAHEKAESYYGKSKFALEQQMDFSRDLVIRPGLILGPGELGSFNRMKNTIRQSGVVPIFGGGHQILQVIEINDLCKAIENALEKRLTGLLVVADPDGIEMKEFFKKLAQRLKTRCSLIPFPMGATLFLLQIFEKLGIRLPLSSENLLGLKTMKHMPSQHDLAKIGIEVKNVEQAIDASI